VGLGAGRRPAAAFKVYAQPMGLRPGMNLDKALSLAAALEDDELVRKLAVRK
jgi:hypothetical protein